MFPSRFDSLDDVRLLTNRMVILPGEPEPRWLAQRAEFARIQKSEREVSRAALNGQRALDAEAERGLVRRVLTVFARS